MKQLYITRILLLLVFVTVTYKQISAQNFHLVKDINTSTNSSPENLHLYSSKPFAVLNGVIYFNADDGVHGRGLWRSDGSEAGTYAVKDSVDPVNITVSNGKVFFASSDFVRLWVSDGTEAGTVQVIGGFNNLNANSLTDFRGMLFFVVSGSASSCQLWKTDGTANGTLLVKNFYDLNNLSNAIYQLNDLTAIKDKLYFSATGVYEGIPRLWVTDGSAAGTHKVSNTLSQPKQLIAATSDNSDSLVYFSAAPQNGTRLLYSTNGDPLSATLVNGFNGSIYYDQNSIQYNGSQDLINVNGIIYFFGSSTTQQGSGLYKFDLNSRDSLIPVQISSLPNSYFQNLAEVNGAIFFTVSISPNLPQLWKSDGTSSGNTLLKNDLKNVFPANYHQLSANGYLYFSANGELWKSDGTVSGTVLIKDMSPVKDFYSPEALTSVDSKVFFSALDDIHGAELWQTDGSVNGTSLVKDINQTSTGSSATFGVTSLNETILFSAFDSKDGNYKLWKSDGTNSGTNLINDTIYTPKTYYSNPVNVINLPLVTKNNQAYFLGSSPSGSGLYKTDGTVAGTVLIKDFTGIAKNSTRITATGNLVYFYIYNTSTTKYELWRTDGTEANTYVIKNDFNNPDNVELVSAGTLLFFIKYAYNANSLWSTDGTPAGTIMLQSFTFFAPTKFTAFNGVFYFYRDDEFYNNGLWRSDGTSIGTVKVTNKVTSISGFVISNNELFFGARNSTGPLNTGTDLFKTDGTEDGTVLIKEVRDHRFTYQNKAPISINGIIYFFTYTAPNDSIRLWKSDGTSQGTQLIGTIDYGLPPDKLVGCNGKLFFIFNKSSSSPVGRKLWESDGTLPGTHPVADNIFNDLTIDDYNLACAGNQLFVSASSYQYGTELYAGYILTGNVITYSSAADGNWNDPATWTANMVPPSGVNIVIHHNIIANMTTICNTLLVAPPGSLTVKTGIHITVLY